MTIYKKHKLLFKITLIFLFFNGIINFVYADFQEDCLKAHNEYRKKHNAKPLELDSKITEISQAYANKLIDGSASGHSYHEGYGENLYYSINKPVDAKGAVKAWYDEIKNYNFKKPAFSSSTGHFTQVVWKGSKKLGCAFAEKEKKIHVVANYEPAGNIMGLFEQNVEAGSGGTGAGGSGASRVLSPMPLLLLLIFACLRHRNLDSVF